jgi:hypothetical protein
LHSKAQWTLGDIAYARGQFNQAFENYAEACINITKLDPAEAGHESAKKKLAYEDLIRHVEEKIELLPEPAKIKDSIKILTEKWKKAGMTDTFRGFVTRIEALGSTDNLE